MRLLSIIIVCAGFCLIPGSLVAQQTTEQRTQEIVSSFAKEKHTVKEKNGVRTEKYKKVVGEPAVKENVRDYSGVYEVSDLGYLINIQVENEGSVQAFGSEAATGGARQNRNFKLEGAKISGAMLTGTKVYDDGSREKFEGLFMNRTVFDSPTDKGVRTFGLGVVGETMEIAGVRVDRLFYELRR